MGDLGDGRSRVDRQRILAWVRFLERVDLACSNAGGHEMAVASRQMPRDRVPTAAQVDQPHLGPVADDDLAVGPLGARST